LGEEPRIMCSSPQLVAEQLTLWESNLMGSIRPHQLFCHIWKKPAYSQNVTQLINHFDIVCSWVTMTIITNENLSARVKAMTGFINLLKALFTLRNYTGCMEIIASLNSSSVSRLRETKAQLSKKSTKILESITSLLEPTFNYKKLRDLIQGHLNEGLPFIPYFGLCFQDLAFIADGIPSKKDDQINWYKNELVFKTLQSCYSAPSYQFTADPVIQNKFQSLVRMPCNLEFDLSVFHEPNGRNPPAVKPAYDWIPK